MTTESRRRRAIKAVKDLQVRLRRVVGSYLVPDSNASAADVKYSAIDVNLPAISEGLWPWRKSAIQIIEQYFKQEEIRNFERVWDGMFAGDHMYVFPLTDYLDSLLKTVQKEPRLVFARDDATLGSLISSRREVKPPTALAEPSPAIGPVGKSPHSETQRLIPSTKRILLIHGRDYTNLLRLADFLHERALEPVILQREPAKGRTITEKFEQVAVTCAFAFVLMTADDLVTNSPSITGAERKAGKHMRFIPIQVVDYPQPRPNVIFELGWICGRLGRDRVCILFQKGTHIHSDLEGVERFEFVESVTEVLPKIERELKAAGLLR